MLGLLPLAAPLGACLAAAGVCMAYRSLCQGQGKRNNNANFVALLYYGTKYQERQGNIMVKKAVKIVGIEVRKSTDPKTRIVSDKYYAHGITADAQLLDGNATISARVPDDMLSFVQCGKVYDLCYRSYNGYNTLEAVYETKH